MFKIELEFFGLAVTANPVITALVIIFGLAGFLSVALPSIEKPKRLVLEFLLKDLANFQTSLASSRSGYKKPSTSNA